MRLAALSFIFSAAFAGVLFSLRDLIEAFAPSGAGAFTWPGNVLVIPAVFFGVLWTLCVVQRDRSWWHVFRPRWSGLRGTALLFLAAPPTSFLVFPVFTPLLMVDLLSEGSCRYCLGALLLWWALACYIVTSVLMVTLSGSPWRFFLFCAAAVSLHVAAMGVSGSLSF